MLVSVYIWVGQKHVPFLKCILNVISINLPTAFWMNPYIAICLFISWIWHTTDSACHLCMATKPTLAQEEPLIVLSFHPLMFSEFVIYLRQCSWSLVLQVVTGWDYPMIIFYTHFPNTVAEKSIYVAVICVTPINI